MLKHLVMIIRILIIELGLDYTQLSHLMLTLFFEENSIMIRVCWWGNWAFENISELSEIRVCCLSLFPPHEASGPGQPLGTDAKWDKAPSCQGLQVRSIDCPVGTGKRARGGRKEAERVPEARGTAGLSIWLCRHQPSLFSNVEWKQVFILRLLFSHLFICWVHSFIQQIWFTS